MWYSKATIYHIFLDRFAGFNSLNDTSPTFVGGNLQGVINKLPYLQELGINCIWLSPIFTTTSYHGYHITDYEQVDPHFGNITTFQILISRAHACNIKVILDFVPNHCSLEHPFFKKAIHGDNEYSKWFYFGKNKKTYKSFLDFKEIPKINLLHSAAAQYFIDNAKYWLSLGVDGLRIDHAIGPPSEFWVQFKKEVKRCYPKSFIFGEIWADGITRKHFNTTDIPDSTAYKTNSISQSIAQLAYKDLFDGVLDFKLQKSIKEYFKNQCHIKEKFKEKVTAHLSQYPDNYNAIGFLDNHDMNRFSFEMKNDKAKIKTAFSFLFNLSIPVVLYYGTESGLIQKEDAKSGKSHADIYARQNMNWESIDNNMLDFFKALINERNDRFEKIT